MYLKELMKIVQEFKVKMQERLIVAKDVHYKNNVLVEKLNKRWKKNKNKL